MCEYCKMKLCLETVHMFKACKVPACSCNNERKCNNMALFLSKSFFKPSRWFSSELSQMASRDKLNMNKALWMVKYLGAMDKIGTSA